MIERLLMRQAYAERLGRHLEALRYLCGPLRAGDREAEGSARRMGAALHKSATTRGFADLAAAARSVEHARREELAHATQELVTELRRAARPPDARRTTVLVASADPELYAIALRHADAVVRADTAADARATLAAQPVGAVVLDVSLADGDGRDLLASLADDPTLDEIPRVVVVPRGQAAMRAECLALGAAEVFDRPDQLDALSDALAALLGRERRAAIELVSDPTTGLFGDDVLMAAAEAAQQRYARTRRTWCLALVSPDAIDRIAADHGVLVRNAALQAVAERLQAVFPEPALVCRASDTELAVLLPDWSRDAAEAAVLAERNQPDLVVPIVDEPEPLLWSLGGVEMASGDPRRALKIARRMLSLAQRMGAGQTVVTRDDRRPGKHRVLLAEDDPELATAVVELLAGLDTEVVLQRDGMEALRLAREQQFALVILDVQIPGMDGMSVLRHLRARESRARTPVVMLTAVGDERHAIRAFELGADDYLVKPVRPALLQARVQRLLGREAVA